MPINSQTAQTQPEPIGISGRALGILMHIVLTDAHISAESLSKQFKEGERAIETALRELREAGYLKTVKNRYRTGRISTNSTITSAGYEFLNKLFAKFDSGGTHGIGLIWNTPSGTTSALPALIPIAIGQNAGFATESNTHVTDDSKKKSIYKDAASYQAHEVQKRNRKRVDRQDKDPRDWTCLDVTFEFSDRVQRYWNIKPWVLSQSRFTPALKAARVKHNTNGLIECLMMDRFFESEPMDTYTDPEFVWKRFIYRFSELLSHVQRIYRFEEDKEALLAQARMEAQASLARFGYTSPTPEEIEAKKAEEEARFKRQQQKLTAEVFLEEDLRMGKIDKQEYEKRLREIRAS